VPPLRERRQDIPLLVEHFLEKNQASPGQRVLSDEALKALLAYDWPGNVRELENSLDRACALCSGPEIEVRDLPTVVHSAPDARDVGRDEMRKVIPMADLERLTILNTITQLNGDKLLAARLLGIGKTTLYRKLKEYETHL
jgi:two-component system response regulator HydG